MRTTLTTTNDPTKQGENSPAAEIVRLLENSLIAFKLPSEKKAEMVDITTKNYQEINRIINNEPGLFLVDDEDANSLNIKIRTLLTESRAYFEKMPTPLTEQFKKVVSFFLGKPEYPNKNFLSQFSNTLFGNRPSHKAVPTQDAVVITNKHSNNEQSRPLSRGG